MTDLNPAHQASASALTSDSQSSHAVDLTAPLRVKKRSGMWMQWDRERILRAMLLAFHAVCSKTEDRRPSPADIEQLATQIEQAALTDHGADVHVEQVQDIVERVLMKDWPAVAKAYILYRNKRAEERAQRLTPDNRAIADYIHAAKYAQWSPEKQRRETYLETVDRVRTMHLHRFGIADITEENSELRSLIDRAFRSVENKRVLPAMRTMQFGGKAVLDRNIRSYNCTFSHCDRLRFFGELLWILLAGPGAGVSVQFQHVERLPAVKFIDEKKVRHIVIDDSCMGWADAVNELFRAYFIHGDYVEFAYHKIRDEGSPLSSGGRAPGHKPLKQALEAVRAILDNARGRQLRPIECFDICCLLADAVLAGGIRRSSLIILFSLGDYEMMTAKAHNNYRPIGHPQGPLNAHRGNANISAVCHRQKVEWDDFRRLISLSREWGEPGFYFTDDEDYGTNPCGEIGMMPRLRREYVPDRSLDFDWRQYRNRRDRSAGYAAPRAPLGAVARLAVDEPRSNGSGNGNGNGKSTSDTGFFTRDAMAKAAAKIEADADDDAITTYGHSTGWQACNLCEVNVAACETAEDLEQAARDAATIGTLQAAYTDFWYLGPVTERVIEREALLGVGLTGMQDRPDLAFDASLLRRAATAVRAQNERVAKMIGVRPAARATTVKPSGTASLELGCVGSGIHHHHARRYFRRVTANVNEAPFLQFRRINPHMCQQKPNGDWVITFPVQAPDHAGTVKGSSAPTFMEQVFVTYENWIRYGRRPDSEALNPGLQHNVSCTVTVQDDEWDTVIQTAWQNRHRVTAMSFFSAFNDKLFPFAPREEVNTPEDEARWNRLISLYRPMDWDKVVETYDGTKFQSIAACAGQQCELVV